MKFNFAAVVTATRTSNVSSEPVMIVNSTKGKFTLTPAVTRAMGLIPGDHITFFSNIAAIEEAIANRDQAVVDAVSEAGIEFGTEEALRYVRETFGQWGICKGFMLKDNKGLPRQSAVRMSEDEKRAYFAANRDLIVGKLHDVLVGRAIEQKIITDATQVTDAILDSMVTFRDIVLTTDAYKGSRLSSTSNMIGTGMQLQFTDAQIWADMKGDLEDPTSVNRKYIVELNEPIDLVMSNGFEDVTVKGYTLKHDIDEVPARIGKKADGSDEELEADSAE